VGCLIPREVTGQTDVLPAERRRMGKMPVRNHGPGVVQFYQSRAAVLDQDVSKSLPEQRGLQRKHQRTERLCILIA
jgi:hypothetical protein